jgi:hypothetical protein
MLKRLKAVDQTMLEAFSQAMAHAYVEWDISPRRQRHLFISVISFAVVFLACANLVAPGFRGELTNIGAVGIGVMIQLPLIIACCSMRKFQRIGNDYNRTEFTEMAVQAEWFRTVPVGIWLRGAIAACVFILVVMGVLSLTNDLGVNRSIMLLGVFVINAVIDIYMDSAVPPPPSSGRKGKGNVTELRYA